MPTITLSFADGDCLPIPGKEGETILAAARRAGIGLSTDCEVGDCQTCRASCRSGEVEYDELSSISLSQEETDSGEILPCVAIAKTDVQINLPYERAHLIPARQFSLKVEDVRRLSASVVGLVARMVGPAPLKFLPGQYVNLQVPGTSEWRSYSMANAPGMARAAPGDVIRCNGPQGAFYLRGGARPILMVAGGTGLAPMVSMVRQMIASRDGRPVTLCFGVTDPRDLFLVEELNGLEAVLPNFDFRAAIAQGPIRPEFHSGLVTELIDARCAASSDIYLCGPPAMTDRARTMVTEYGAVASSIFLERFLPAGGGGSQSRAHENACSARTSRWSAPASAKTVR
jgi:benzoate/toluate 1,2-dioxygenase reductase subunit